MTIGRAPVALSAVAVLASIVGVVLLYSLFGPAGDTVLHRIALVLLSGVAPAAFLSAIALLHPARRIRATVLPLVVLAGAASGLFAVAFAVGFDEADAGGPRSALGNSVIPAALATLVLLATAFAVAVGSLLPLPRTLRVVLGSLVGMIAAPLVMAISTFGFQLMALFELGLLLTLVVVRARAHASLTPTAGAAPAPGPLGPPAEPPAAPAAAAPVEPPAPPAAPAVPTAAAPSVIGPTAAFGVRTSAVVSLAITMLALVGGVTAGIALSGNPAATRAMGLMLAAGNLAAVPLIVSLTLLLAPGRLVALVGTLVAAAGIAASCVYLAVTDDPADPHAFTAIMVIAASVGVWAATVAWTRTPFPVRPRLSTAAIIGLGAALVYTLAAIGTAGGVLALVSGYLVFRGIRKPREPQPAAA